jgi:hypothetical protein
MLMPGLGAGLGAAEVGAGAGVGVGAAEAGVRVGVDAGDGAAVPAGPVAVGVGEVVRGEDARAALAPAVVVTALAMLAATSRSGTISNNPERRKRRKRRGPTDRLLLKPWPRVSRDSALRRQRRLLERRDPSMGHPLCRMGKLPWPSLFAQHHYSLHGTLGQRGQPPLRRRSAAGEPFPPPNGRAHDSASLRKYVSQREAHAAGRPATVRDPAARPDIVAHQRRTTTPAGQAVTAHARRTSGAVGCYAAVLARRSSLGIGQQPECCGRG